MVTNKKWRQIALCAWGSQYLAGGNELEEWYRHGVFWRASQQFRAYPERDLIAADFSSWLYWLRARGATRLSLHPLDGIPTSEALVWEGQLIQVHFPQGCERWLIGEEKTPCESANEIALKTDTKWHWIPDSAYYAGEIDSWWCLGMGDPIQIPEIDWEATAARVKAELFPEDGCGLRGPWALPVTTPLPSGNDEHPDWARLPILPHSKHLTLPLRLLHYLQSERDRFDNDTNIKNEANIYMWATTKEQDALQQWSDRLDAWLDTLQMAAANELRWIDGIKGGAVRQLHRSRVKIAERALSESVKTQEPAPVAAEPRIPPPQPITYGDAPPERITDHIPSWLTNLVVLAVLSLFIAALANVISRFEWLSFLIALPWMLYIRKKK